MGERYFIPLKTVIFKMIYIFRFYLAAHTVRLCHKNQSINISEGNTAEFFFVRITPDT